MVERSSASTVRQAPGPVSKIENWGERRACKDWDFKANGDPFFPASAAEADTKEARQICQACPVRLACLEDSITSPFSRKHGIYGGLTGEERYRIFRNRENKQSKQKNRKLRKPG